MNISCSNSFASINKRMVFDYEIKKKGLPLFLEWMDIYLLQMPFDKRSRLYLLMPLLSFPNIVDVVVNAMLSMRLRHSL